MSIFLYILATIISLHHTFFIVGMRKVGILHKNLFSAAISFFLIVANVLAMAFQSWGVLVLAFTFYCITVFIELVYKGITHQKPATLQIPINLMMIASSIIIFFTQSWIIFGISYAVYWLLTLFIARKRTKRQIQSQKI